MFEAKGQVAVERGHGLIDWKNKNGGVGKETVFLSAPGRVVQEVSMLV